MKIIPRLATSSFTVVAIACLFGSALTRPAAAFPEPSIYPLSWELKFKHGEPQRIIVELPGESIPKAYWYMTFNVTNKGRQDVNFLPVFDMVTRRGKVIRSDRGIPKTVFDRVASASGNRLLEPMVKIAGELLVGEDHAKDGVAIWEEPEAEMGEFSIFVGGLAGESVALKDDDGKAITDDKGRPVILFKTLQLNYTVSGDEVYPGIDPITKKNDRWVMR